MISVMLDPAHWTVLAGLDVVEAIRVERAVQVRRGVRPGTVDSVTLTQHQIRLARRGFLGAELVRSIYGYSVRYDSGLQNWGILAGCRAGTLDGSYEAAVAWARNWQAQDPTHRYVSVRNTEMPSSSGEG